MGIVWCVEFGSGCCYCDKVGFDFELVCGRVRLGCLIGGQVVLLVFFLKVVRRVLIFVQIRGFNWLCISDQ